MKLLKLNVVMAFFVMSLAAHSESPKKAEKPCPPKQSPSFNLGSLFEIPNVLNFFNWGNSETPACKDHNPCDESVPLCPENSTLLGPEYPVMAVSMGDHSTEGHEVVAMVDSLINENPNKPPQVFLSISRATEKNVKEMIKNHPSLSEELKKKWLGATTVPERKLQWHQDFYETYVDPNTGMPRITPFEVHDYTAQKTNKRYLSTFSKSLKKTCNINGSNEKLFSPLDFDSGSMGKGARREYRGGNIEPAPGGGCMVGRATEPDDSKWEKFKNQACKDSSFTVELDTSALHIGHVDEIVKFVKTDDECGYALLVGDPSLGMETMLNSGDEPLKV